MTRDIDRCTIVVYKHNLIELAHEVAPSELATQFIEAMRGGYLAEPCGGGLEHAYRLWLTAKDGADVSWDRSNDEALMSALERAWSSVDEDTRMMLVAAIWGTS